MKTLALARIIRSNARSISVKDALDAARFLLASQPADVARYRASGFTRDTSALRMMAVLHRGA